MRGVVGMTNKVITRTELANAIFCKVGLSRHESTNLVEHVIETISSALEEDGEVKISSFGTWTIQHKRERIGRNPRTGVESKVTARKVLGFRMSNGLKQHINKRK